MTRIKNILFGGAIAAVFALFTPSLSATGGPPLSTPCEPIMTTVVLGGGCF